jgi:hypothetical protein
MGIQNEEQRKTEDAISCIIRCPSLEFNGTGMASGVESCGIGHVWRILGTEVLVLEWNENETDGT